MPSKERCPFCDVLVSGNWFGQHLFNHHQDNLFINNYGGGNLPRLLKSQDKPFEMKLGKMLTNYYTCLGCHHTSKRQPFIQRHFPECREKHNHNLKELYSKYSSNKEELESIKPIQPVVVEGYSEEQVLALIGAMMESIKSSQREEKEAKNKADYYEEKIRDTTSVNLDDDDESIPEFYPDDEDIEFYLPEDIVPLVNMAEKMKLRISNKAVEEAYQKWYKMPIKKKSSK